MRERAEHKAQIAAKQARLEAKKRLASLKAQQREDAIAEETEIAEAKIDLEKSIALDKTMEDAEVESEYEEEEESSHERRLKQHYAFPNLGEVAVEDGAKACQVLCGLGTSSFKVIDESAPSTKNGPFPEERASEGREAPWPTGGWGGGRPKVPGDAGSAAAAGASRGEALWREPMSTAQASREPPEDHTGTQEAHEAGTTRGREAEAWGDDANDGPDDGGSEAGARDHKGTTTPRLYATSRQRHSSEPSGGRRGRETPGEPRDEERARSRKHAATPLQRDGTQTAGGSTMSHAAVTPVDKESLASGEAKRSLGDTRGKTPEEPDPVPEEDTAQPPARQQGDARARESQRPQGAARQGSTCGGRVHGLERTREARGTRMGPADASRQAALHATHSTPPPPDDRGRGDIQDARRATRPKGDRTPPHHGANGPLRQDCQGRRREPPGRGDTWIQVRSNLRGDRQTRTPLGAWTFTEQPGLGRTGHGRSPGVPVSPTSEAHGGAPGPQGQHA